MIRCLKCISETVNDNIISWLFNLLHKFRVLSKLMLTVVPLECRNLLQLFRHCYCCGDCKSIDLKKKKASPVFALTVSITPLSAGLTSAVRK